MYHAFLNFLGKQYLVYNIHPDCSKYSLIKTRGSLQLDSPKFSQMSSGLIKINCYMYMYPWPHLVIHTVYVKSSLDFEKKKYLFILHRVLLLK
jgi:hypothetical protein